MNKAVEKISPLWLLLLALLLLAGCGNVAPEADAGPDQVVLVGEPVTLDGSASSDYDDDPLTYAWAITSAPETSLAALAGAASVNPTLTPDVDGNYTIALTVSDDDWSDTDTVIVTALPEPPLADGTVPVLVFHTANAIVAWNVGGDPVDADTIINTEYPDLVADWDAGLIDITQIFVEPIEAYQPELYEAVDGEIVKK